MSHVLAVTYTSGCFGQMSRGQLSFVLFLCGLQVGAGENHRKNRLDYIVLMVVDIRKLVLGNLT